LLFAQTFTRKTPSRLQIPANRIKLRVTAERPSVSDEPKELDPFKPDEPSIPGVTGGRVRAKPVAEPPHPTGTQYRGSVAASVGAHKYLLLAIVVVTSFLIGLGIFWWKHAGPPAEVQTAPVAAPSVDLVPAPALQTDAKLPVGPGPVATTTELAKTWSSKRFLFRAPHTADDVPAMVVHLPGNVYWALSMREPFGSCALEYVTDTARLETVYHLSATHPMVGDPCNHAVYDLERYAPGLNGEVRGALVSGEAVRPPLAIEITVRGRQIVATQIEH
jgi:hypothetical protein